MKQVILIVACVCLAGISLFSCGWETKGLDRLNDKYPVEDGDTTCCDGDSDGDQDRTDTEQETPQLAEGAWMGRMVLHGTIDPLELGPDSAWPMILTNYFVAEISESGDQFILTFCDQDVKMLAGGGLGESDSPMALREAISETPIVLDYDGQTIGAQRVAWTWGLENLSDRFVSIPNKKEDEAGFNAFVDAHEFDEDRDGNPGVTVKVLNPSGYRYMIRRSIWDFNSGLRDDSGERDRISGSLIFDIYEGAVGYDGPGSLATVAPITAKADGNTYEFVFVEADAVDGDMDMDTEAETTVDGDTEADPDADPSIDGDSDPDPSVDGDAEPELDGDVEADSDSELENEMDAEHEAEVELEQENEADSELEAESTSKKAAKALPAECIWLMQNKNELFK